jgi:hypothetical protein
MSGPECRKSYQLIEMRACSRCGNEGIRTQQLMGNDAVMSRTGCRNEGSSCGNEGIRCRNERSRKQE